MKLPTCTILYQTILATIQKSGLYDFILMAYSQPLLARAVDGTMLTPLSALASEQANLTELTMKKCLQFLDYATTQDDAILTYKASDMILAIHSDASYLSEPKARS